MSTDIPTNVSEQQSDCRAAWRTRIRRQVAGGRGRRRADVDLPNQLLGGHISIQGYTAGDAKASEDTLNFSVLTGARPMVEVFPLEQAAQAYEKMMTSKVRFRAVLKISE